ncbi:hypothetical protein QQF64_021211 [Cirrhinus molitorella]|uniref:Uncharacterized protein n=1 Tax=Cirrhinus molitorella TaxID=172907 RepID=A0ABR3LBD3_9TELE
MAACAGGIPATSAEARHDVIDRASSFLVSVTETRHILSFLRPHGQKRKSEPTRELDGALPLLTGGKMKEIPRLP